MLDVKKKHLKELERIFGEYCPYAEIWAFGSRINTFGQIHNNDDAFGYYGPDSWRTEGASYSYEYQLWKTGILSAPKVWRITGED